MTPKYNWALDYLAGRTNKEIAQYKNILYLNGMLDPWSAGGVANFTNDELKELKKMGSDYFVMADAAHHLDLRSPNSLDPESVVQGRELVVKMLDMWINKRIDFNAYFGNNAN